MSSILHRAGLLSKKNPAKRAPLLAGYDIGSLGGPPPMSCRLHEVSQSGTVYGLRDRCQPAQITAEHRILAPYRSPEKIFSQALEPNALCRIDDIGRDQGLCVGGL